MDNEEELFTICCVNCNNQIFRFSKNLLVNSNDIFLKCPKFNGETHVIYNGINGVVIEKN